MASQKAKRSLQQLPTSFSRFTGWHMCDLDIGHNKGTDSAVLRNTNIVFGGTSSAETIELNFIYLHRVRTNIVQNLESGAALEMETEAGG